MPQDDQTNARSTAEDGASRIVAALEEDIVLGLLAPRVRLVEDDLMERFEAKRHVVREAFAQLEQAGLIERKRNVGAMVRTFSGEEVHHLYDMRILLETEAMRRIELPLPAPALKELTQVQARHDEVTEREDPRGIFHANEEFHCVLFSHSGNTYLSQAIEDFARRTHAIRFGILMSRERQLQSQREHHALIEALRQGDRELLLELTIAHLVPPRDHYLKTREALLVEER